MEVSRKKFKNGTIKEKAQNSTFSFNKYIRVLLLVQMQNAFEEKHFFIF